MGKFFNKNELVLIILLILLLDLNGFCNVALNHIAYSKKRYTFIFLLAIVLLLYDVYVFHTVANYRELTDVTFTVDKKYKHVTCKEDIDSEINNNKVRTNELVKIKQNCENKIDHQNIWIEKIVINYIVCVLVILCIFAIFINNHEQSVPSLLTDGQMNDVNSKMVLSLPIIITAVILFSYVNY